MFTESDKKEANQRTSFIFRVTVLYVEFLCCSAKSAKSVDKISGTENAKLLCPLRLWGHCFFVHVRGITARERLWDHLALSDQLQELEYLNQGARSYDSIRTQSSDKRAKISLCFTASTRKPCFVIHN